MGFGRQFAQYRLPEWTAHYLDYQGLKESVKTLRLSRLTTQDHTESPTLSKGYSLAVEPLIPQEYRRQSSQELFQSELEKVSDFYKVRRQDLEISINGIFTHLQGSKEKLLMLSSSTDLRHRLPSLWRAIHQVHRNLWCLEVFCEINLLAGQRLVEQLRPRHPEIAERALKTLQGADFAHTLELQGYRKRLYRLIADHITDGDVTAAKQLLRNSETYYDPGDVCRVACSLGMAVVLVLWAVSLVLGVENYSLLVPSMPVFRLTFCLLMTGWVCAVVLYFFETRNINWVFVFDIQSQVEYSYLRIMRIVSHLTVLWAILLLLHSWHLRYGSEDDHRDFLSLATMAVCLCFCLFPGYPDVRRGLAAAMGHIFISPFGKVDFRHFFLADVLTSLAKPLSDIARSSCYLASDSWLLSTPPHCPHETFWFCVITMLPLYWRAAQCVVKYRATRNAYPHLFNLSKYLVSLLVVLALYIPMFFANAGSYVVWLALSVLATGYCAYWDLVVDFGLLRVHTQQRAFAPWVYYAGGLLNALLRCVWVLTLFPLDFLGHDQLEVELVLLGVSLLELLRRGLWAVFRVENEKFSNLEKYRKADIVPKVPKIILD